MENLTDLLRVAKEKETVRTAAKAERFSRVILAENEITNILLDFYKFLDVNGYKLIGKKIFLANNEKSKIFATLIKEFTDSIEISDTEKGRLQYFSISRTCGKTSLLNISICIWGGNCDDNTNYTQYIERGIYDIFEIDENGILRSFNPDNLTDFKIFVEAGVLAIKSEALAIEQKIAELKSLLYSMNRLIPNSVKNL